MTYKTDYINIGLMLVSCALAFYLPFELFLFSYAVIGPLHYLTEISWLHQRQYFSTGRRDYMMPAILCLVLSSGVIFHDIFMVRGLFPGLISRESVTSTLQIYSKWFSSLIFSAFLGSLGLITLKSTWKKIALFILGLVAGYYLRDYKSYNIWMGVFIPTLIHVYVFTGLFMLYGAMKARSVPGYISVCVLIGCALLFVFVQYVPKDFNASTYIKNAIIKSGFVSVNETAISFFKPGRITEFDIFGSRRGLMVQRFIAFAYTYHYLNWFSKTEIIRWHQVPKKWLIASILIWIGSMALYYYDYRTGLIALFFLSLLHVFLEFPLNIKSIMGIWEELRNRIRGKKISPAPH